MPLRDATAPATDTLYLIDGSSFLFRGYYAYGDLARSDGFPTNALYIVMRILLKFLRDAKPAHALFLLDGTGKNFRHELYPSYKANRVAMPEPLALQIDPLLRGVPLLGLPVLVGDGFEADDYIASLAARFKNRLPVVILASDKDLRQCLDADVTMWDPGGKTEKIITVADFQAEYGITPASWPDLQALTGDASDNIPGIPGIGPKTALAILHGHPTLEDVRDRPDDVPPAARKKLEGRLDEAFLFRELTRLRTDLLPEADLEAFAVRPADRIQVVRFLEEFEFKSLAREVDAALSRSLDAPQAAPATSTGKGGESSGPRQLSLLGGPAGALEPEKVVVFPEAAPRDLPDPSGRDMGLVPVPGGFAVGYPDAEYRVRAKPGSPEAAALAGRLVMAGSVAVPSLKELAEAYPVFETVPLRVWRDLGLGAYLLQPESRNYSWERLKDGLFADPGFDAAGYGPAEDGRLAA
ncbi:5'-3' exonuclease, partial [Desulfolutivibrio sp.]|uniref:5'-3' exonuclease n=1 Tax=Desulfolutivibrio sp. TaxID=2773296 RepID=UPI002F963348